VTRIGIAPQDCGDPDVVWLQPRAVAMLVTLRAAPLNIWQVAHAIGELEPSPEPHATRVVVDACADLGLVRTVSEPGLVYPRVWLTDDGIAWLERNGLTARYRP
jgi:hypothetical protein